jgi:hypothetical protein
MLRLDPHLRHDSLSQSIVELDTCLDSHYIERPPIPVSASSSPFPRLFFPTIQPQQKVPVPRAEVPCRCQCSSQMVYEILACWHLPTT